MSAKPLETLFFLSENAVRTESYRSVLEFHVHAEKAISLSESSI